LLLLLIVDMVLLFLELGTVMCAVCLLELLSLDTADGRSPAVAGPLMSVSMRSLFFQSLVNEMLNLVEKTVGDSIATESMQKKAHYKLIGTTVSLTK
jgi:hypothetical protein